MKHRLWLLVPAAAAAVAILILPPSPSTALPVEDVVLAQVGDYDYDADVVYPLVAYRYSKYDYHNIRYAYYRVYRYRDTWYDAPAYRYSLYTPTTYRYNRYPGYVYPPAYRMYDNYRPGGYREGGYADYRSTYRYWR